MKDCMSTHSILHSLTGCGVGLLLAGFVPLAGNTAITLGVVLLIVGIGVEMLLADKKKRKR